MSDWASAVGPVGGALAALAGGGLGIFAERLRWRAQERTRWLDLRRQLAVRFLDAVQRVHDWTTTQTNMLLFPGLQVSRATAGDGTSAQFETAVSHREASARVLEADALVRALDAEIRLVGNEDEIAAAAHLRETVWAAASAYARYHDADDDSRDAKKAAYESATNDYRAARDAFEATVRKDLVPAGDERPRRPREPRRPLKRLTP